MSGALPAQRGEVSPRLLLEQTLLAFYQDYDRVPYLFQDEPLASQRCFELGTNYIQLHLVENPANNAAQNERSAFSPVKLTRCGECTVATLLKPMQWPRGPTIVFGQAGMGKSTLSQYMAYLWSQRNSISDCPVGLAECEIVFYLPLRYLKRYRPSEAFKPGAMTDDILAGVLLFLFRQLYPQKTLEAERGDKLSVSMLATLVKERADSVLFIVDGLDEITTELKDSQGFHHQFVRYLLLQPRVMLTSRPIVIQPSLLPVKQQKEDCRWLEVKGFHEDSMNAYISDYFGQRGEDLVSKGEQLQCYLNNNALLFDICHTPINLALLCVVWEEDKTLLQAPPGPDIKPEVKQDKDVTTPSFNTIDIYQRLLLFLQRRYVKRSLALQPNAVDCINKFNEKTLDEQQAYIQTYCADLMDFLMVLATYGMTHDELAFSGDTLTNLLEQQAPLLRKFYQRLPSAYQHSLKKQHEPLPGEPPVSKHRLQQIAFLQGLREFGLLAFASPGGNLAGQEIWFSFLHLSFQEYLAAHHLVARLRRCLEDRRDPQQDSAIRWTVVRYKYEPRYRRFWQFVMGEVSQDNLLFAAIEALRCGVLPIKHWGVQDSEANERIEQDLKNCWLSGVSAQADNAVKQALAIALRQDLNHLNVKVRKQALELLEALPPGFTDNADILTGLLEHLIEHESASLQCDILCAIALLGAPLATHETVIKRVIAGLESEYEHVQEAALWAVSDLGAPLATHEAVITGVIAGLASNNSEVQSSALGAVEVLGAPLATREAVIMGVIAWLESEHEHVQYTALRAVKALLGAPLAIHEAVITGIIAGLASDNWEVQCVALEAVSALRAPLATREAVIKGILAGLESDNPLVRCTALKAVKALRAPLATHEVFITGVIAVLASDKSWVQRTALEVVIALGAPLATHEAVIKRVIAGLESDNSQVQRTALQAVATLDAPLATQEAFIKSLTAELASDNLRVQCAALEVVQALRVPLAAHEAVIKGVIAGLASDNAQVQYTALQTVSALREPLATHEAFIKHIIAGLESEDKYVQKNALRAVGALGPPLATHEAVITGIIAGLASDDWEVQCVALEAVSALRAPLVTHEAFMKSIIDGLTSSDWQVQQAALRAVEVLRELLATHAAFIKRIIIELASNNCRVQQAALEVVQYLGAPLATHEAVITGIIAGLASKNRRVQRTALRVVQILGAPLATHEAVITGVISGLESEYKYVQKNALQAVSALGTALATNQRIINSLLIMLASDSRKWHQGQNKVIATLDVILGYLFMFASDSWELQQWQSEIVAALDAILGHSVLKYCLSHAELSQAAHQWSPKTVIQRYLCQTKKKFMLYLEKHSSCYLVLDGEYVVIHSVHSVPLTREEFTLLLSLTDGHNLLFPTAHALSGYTVVRPTEGSKDASEKVDNAIYHRSVFKPSSTEITASLCEADNAKCILPVEQDSHYDNIIQPVTIKKSNVFKDFSRYLTSAEKTQLKDALTVINELLVDMDIGDESGDKASLMRLRSSLLSKATDLAEFDISQEGAKAYLASIIQQTEEIEKAQQVQATYFR